MTHHLPPADGCPAGPRAMVTVDTHPRKPNPCFIAESDVVWYGISEKMYRSQKVNELLEAVPSANA